MHRLHLLTVNVIKKEISPQPIFISGLFLTLKSFVMIKSLSRSS